MHAPGIRRKPLVTRGATVVATVAVLGCGDPITGPGEPITELPRQLSTSEAQLIGAGNAFGVDLLRQIYAATPDSTVFLSPLSASMALGMTLNGAAGETYAQMHDVLGFGDMTLEEIDASYSALIDLLGGLDPRVQFGLGNAIFHRDTFVMETPFLDDVREYFDARVEGLDFDAPSAVPTINAWVSDATEGRIDEIVEAPIDPLTVAFLINAIYFKGDWTAEFDPADTYTGPFHLADGGTQDVRLMSKEDSLGYRSDGGWQAVEMPYGGGAWAMTVAVPLEGSTLDDVVADLDAILDPSATWEERPIEIHLPRFELDWERKLNDDLNALGMIDAFSDVKADFTPMYRHAIRDGLHVEQVKQKTFLKVDEVGTEAAAVTVVEVQLECAGCGGPQVMKADRPFLIAIRERLSGTVLFVGLIIEAPTE